MRRWVDAWRAAFATRFPRGHLPLPGIAALVAPELVAVRQLANIAQGVDYIAPERLPYDAIGPAARVWIDQGDTEVGRAALALACAISADDKIARGQL